MNFLFGKWGSLAERIPYVFLSLAFTSPFLLVQKPSYSSPNIWHQSDEVRFPIWNSSYCEAYFPLSKPTQPINGSKQKISPKITFDHFLSDHPLKTPKFSGTFDANQQDPTPILKNSLTPRGGGTNLKSK